MNFPRSVRSSLDRLPDPVNGVLWMASASLFYSFIYIAVRNLTDALSISQVIFFRATLGALFMLPWLARAGLIALRTRRMKLYILRVALAYAGTVGWVYGIARMELADANALLFTLPLFTVIFAALLLRETVGLHRWAATIIGFAGALIIIRPGVVELSLPALATLFAAAAFSLALIATKSLVGTEDPNAVVFYLYTLMIPIAVGPAIADWTPLAWGQVPWLLALGVLTVGAQQCSTRAFKAAPASVVMPLHFLQLPMIAVLAFVAFDQTSDIWTWVGAAVICASTYYITLRESRPRRSGD